mmetsp:Transcript_13426/g.39640  ORF Transcript_13426/g.39640 Transcript_13426/m.39640 type:complete len:311 (+) Transcript_13426:706-1638(+)
MVSVQKNIYKVTGRGRVCLCDFLSSNSISLASARCAHAHTIIDLGDALSIRERDRTPALRKRRKETESDQCANTRARRPAFEGGAHAAARTLTTRRLPTASMLTFSESSAQLLAGPPFAAGAAGAALGRVLGRVLVRVLQQLRVAPLDERRHLLHLCDGRRLGRHDQQLRARERRVVRRDALQPRLRLPLALDPRLPPDARLVRRRHRVQQLDPPLLLAQRGGRLRVPRIVAVEREPTVLAVRLLEGGPPVDVPVGKPVAAEARARVARDGGPGELYQRRRRQLRRVDRHARARVLPHPVGAVPRLPLRL